MGWHESFGMHDIWGYWWFFMILWWFGGARLFVAARRLHRREDPALTTLRDRFARGEIDRAEYEERRAVLKGRTASIASTASTASTTPRGDGPAWPDLSDPERADSAPRPT